MAVTAARGEGTWHLLSPCRWPEIALVGILLNLGVLIAAPVARPDLNLWEKALSYYAVGPWGVLQAIAFVAMGVACIALAAALGQSPPASRWALVVVAGLVVSGFGSFGLVVYPMGVPSPRTFIGDLHQSAGTVGGVAQLVAALAFVLAVRVDRRWQPLFWPALVAFVLAVAGAVVTQTEIWWPGLPIPMGASSRLVVIPLIVLWGLVSIRLRRRCMRPAIRPAAAT